MPWSWKACMALNIPSTGKALHRDFQLLAVLADHAEALARSAYRSVTGQDPSIDTPAYAPEEIHGMDDPRQDRLFKTERLRPAMAFHAPFPGNVPGRLRAWLAQRLIAEGAPAAAVLEQFDLAVGVRPEEPAHLPNQLRR